MGGCTFPPCLHQIAAREDEPPPGCLIPLLARDQRREPVPAPTGSAVVGHLKVRDITHADDLAVCSTSDAASHLSAATTHAAGAVLSSFGEHGLVPNYGPAKTAVLLSPVGCGSKAVRQQIFNVQKGLLPTLLEHGCGVMLQAVSKYKHLGCMVSHTGHLLTEIRRRISCAGGQFQEGRRLVYCCPQVSLERRVRLFQSRVLSVLFHGAGSWHILAAGEYKEVSAAYLSFCRKLLRIPKDANQHWSLARIFVQVGLPDTLTCLRIERLRFLAQLSKNASDTVWAVARADSGFVAAMRDALGWLFELLSPTVDLPSPLLDWGPWAHLFPVSPKKWKGWLKRAAELQLRRMQLQAGLELTQRGLWEPLPTGTMADWDSLGHCCLLCKVAFTTKQSWAAHAARTCQACGKQFATHSKFVRHLQALPRCLSVVEGLHRESRLHSLSDAVGHAQAPPAGSVFQGPEVVTSISACQQLLDAIVEHVPSTSSSMLQLVRTVVAPFPDFRTQ